LSFDSEAFIPLTSVCEPVRRTFRPNSLCGKGTYRFFEVGDADIDTGEVRQVHEATSADILAKNRLRLRVQAGDILLPNHRDSLVCKTASGVGRSAVYVTPELDGAITSNRFTALRPKIDPEVCIALLNSAKLREQLVLHSRGSASFDIREKVLVDVRVPRRILSPVEVQADVKKLASTVRSLRTKLLEATTQFREAADRLMLP